jgi:hypothetical protein
MKIRFEVDQADCLRNGIDCPKSIVQIDVDPSKMSQAHRDLIADRMQGIDVYKLSEPDKSERILAKRTTLESLIEACKLDVKE